MQTSRRQKNPTLESSAKAHTAHAALGPVLGTCMMYWLMKWRRGTSFGSRVGTSFGSRVGTSFGSRVGTSFLDFFAQDCMCMETK